MVHVLPLGGHCCEVVPRHPKERVRSENYMVGMCCHCCEVVPGGFGGPVVRQPWLAGIPQMTQHSMRLLWELMCCGLKFFTPCADRQVHLSLSLHSAARTGACATTPCQQSCWAADDSQTRLIVDPEAADSSSAEHLGLKPGSCEVQSCMSHPVLRYNTI